MKVKSRRQRFPGNLAWIALPACGAITLLILGTWGQLAAPRDAPENESQGRGMDGASGNDSTRSRDALTARQILGDMVAAYGNATMYQDRAEIRLRYGIGERWLEDAVRLDVALARPNRCRVGVTHGDTHIDLACDGEQLTCRVRDPTTNDFDNQLVTRSAPEELSVPLLYSATEYLDPSRPRELLSLLMGLPMQLELTPFGLVLGRDANDRLFDASSKRTRLDDRMVDGRNHYRVMLTGPMGSYTFWIDADTKLLRRIVYPTTGLFPPETEQDDGFAASLTADFLDARTRDVDSQQFAVAAGADARPMRHFVLPPPEVPSSVLGRPVGDYAFTGLDDRPHPSSQWSGKLAVMLWFQDHPASRAALAELGPVYEKFKTHGGMVFWAVCTEPTTAMSHQDVASLARAWNVSIPVVRDLEAFGRDVFLIDRAPTLVLVSPQGVVQLVEEGADTELSEQLPIVLERLLANEDLASDFLRYLKQQREEYRQHLAAASVDAPATEIVLPPLELAPRSHPRFLRVTPRWKCQELKTPGNMLVTEDVDRGPIIHVLDGWHEVVEIGPEGAVRQRHALSIPGDGAVTYLRSATDHQGRRYFVGTARLAQQLFVFDSSWRLVFGYPQADQKHEGIQDVQMCDLDADGALELYVAFAGILGVQRVDLTGKRQWSNRSVHSILSLELPPDVPRWRQQLLLTNQRGQIVPLSASGQDSRPISVGSRAVHQLVASHHPIGRSATFCGLSYTITGNQVAVGMDSDLREVWSYDLPRGAFQTQLLNVTTAQFLSGPGFQWLMAGPDGSIHVVADNGDFADSFGTGDEISGLAFARLGSDDVLLIASGHAVTAWNIEHHVNQAEP